MENTKYKTAKKKLLTEAGILAGVLCAMAGAIYFLDDYSLGYQTQTQELEGKVNGIIGEASVIRDKFIRIQKNAALYKTAMEKSVANELTVDREELRDKFSLFKAQYNLNNIHLTMGPVTDPADARFKHKTGSVVSSEVQTSFDALSDEEAYRLLAAVRDNLSGSTKVTKLTLGLGDPLNGETLKRISDKGTYAIIKGDLKFTWFGIKPAETTDDASKQPKKP